MADKFLCVTKPLLPGQAPFVPGRRIPLAALAERLYAAYGPQGWWPLLEHRGSNPTLTGRLTGYHPGDYSFPRTEAQRLIEEKPGEELRAAVAYIQENWQRRYGLVQVG